MASDQRDIDRIIEGVTLRQSRIAVEQLQKRLPADDDGLWFFFVPGVQSEIQIESSSGMCPFLVETNEQSSYDARTAHTVEEAVEMIIDYLTPFLPQLE